MQDEMNDLQYTKPEDPDIIKVVRCKNCGFFSELLPGTEPICLKYGSDFKQGDYCSKGAGK